MTEGIILRLFSLDWTGRTGRKEAWSFVPIAALAFWAVGRAEQWLVGTDPDRLRAPFVLLALLVPLGFALQVRRLHDAGRSGRWLILSLVPLVSALLLGFLLLAPSRDGYQPGRRAPFLRGLAILFVAASALFVLSRTIWHPYFIPSSAMKPTLLVGDYLIVSTLPFTPAPGDVVIFRNTPAGVAFVKRVIGLPGDRVQMKGGVAYVNGVAAPQVGAGTFEEAYVPQSPEGRLPPCVNQPAKIGDPCISNRRIETLPNGASHDLLDLGPTPQDNTPAYTVPPGHYFMLGDSRDNSNDSRFDPPSGPGMVSAENLIGRAERILFSTAAGSYLAFWAWRPGRFFVPVN